MFLFGSASLGLLFYPHVPRVARVSVNIGQQIQSPEENYRLSPVLTR